MKTDTQEGKNTPEQALDLIQQAVYAIIEDEKCVHIGSYSDGYINTDEIDKKIKPFCDQLASQSSELSRLREDNERLVKYVFELGERLDGKAASLTELKKVLSEMTKKLVEL